MKSLPYACSTRPSRLARFNASPCRVLAMMALIGTLQACSTNTVPSSSPSPKPGGVVMAPPPVVETRKPGPAAGAVIPIPGAEKADIRVGDKLWYSGGDGTGPQITIMREVTSVQENAVLYRQTDIDRSGKPGKAFRNRRQSLASLELDNPAKASGQVRFVDFPLGLGKTWSYRYQNKSKSGSLQTYDIVARVEAEEMVRTPAGNFKALRILHGGQWNVPVLDQGTMKISSGSLRSTVWFAPAIGNWVRFESENLNAQGGVEVKVSQELVRFERRTQP